MKSRQTSTCSVCDAKLELAIELPRFPLTGIFRREGEIADFPCFDQALLVCPACSHGQLQTVLDPATLYGQDYGFRTSASATASKGARFFARNLDRVAGGRRFARVLEFGCSDAVLLNMIRDRADRLVGVDPVLRGREGESADAAVTLIGAQIQDVDIRAALGGAPDLIIAQHTLEHLPDPRGTLRHILDAATPETLFILEFPCFDPLLEQLRFDQVFHQHTQYFSVRSFQKLLDLVDASPVDLAFHYTYWGALLAAFRKGRGAAFAAPETPDKSVGAIRRRYERFRTQMASAAEALDECGGSELYGYGAALMLPVLGYHLRTDFSDFAAILDDDPAKDGVGYANLPVRVRRPGDLDFTGLTICLTAMDNRRPILRRLGELNPKRIINPLCYI